MAMKRMFGCLAARDGRKLMAQNSKRTIRRLGRNILIVIIIVFVILTQP
jgi:hypothetical protein